MWQTNGMVDKSMKSQNQAYEEVSWIGIFTLPILASMRFAIKETMVDCLDIQRLPDANIPI